MGEKITITAKDGFGLGAYLAEPKRQLLWGQLGDGRCQEAVTLPENFFIPFRSTRLLRGSLNYVPLLSNRSVLELVRTRNKWDRALAFTGSAQPA